MTDILTEEEILKNPWNYGHAALAKFQRDFDEHNEKHGYYESIVHALRILNTPISEMVAALQAQNKRLVEALENMEAAFSSMHYDSHDVKKCPFDHCHNCDGFNVIMQAREALEALKGRK